jgi:hypothetical protein
VHPAKRSRSDSPPTPDKKLKVSDTEVKVVKQQVKGRFAVDSEYSDSTSVRVYDDGKKVWAVTLNQTKMNTNNNKYYNTELTSHSTSSERKDLVLFQPALRMPPLDALGQSRLHTRDRLSPVP